MRRAQTPDNTAITGTAITGTVSIATLRCAALKHSDHRGRMIAVLAFQSQPCDAPRSNAPRLQNQTVRVMEVSIATLRCAALKRAYGNRPKVIVSSFNRNPAMRRAQTQSRSPVVGLFHPSSFNRNPAMRRAQTTYTQETSEKAKTFQSQPCDAPRSNNCAINHLRNATAISPRHPRPPNPCPTYLSPFLPTPTPNLRKPSPPIVSGTAVPHPPNPHPIHRQSLTPKKPLRKPPPPFSASLALRKHPNFLPLTHTKQTHPAAHFAPNFANPQISPPLRRFAKIPVASRYAPHPVTPSKQCHAAIPPPTTFFANLFRFSSYSKQTNPSSSTLTQLTHPHEAAPPDGAKTSAPPSSKPPTYSSIHTSHSSPAPTSSITPQSYKSWSPRLRPR